MQLSKQEIDPNLEIHIQNTFYQVVSDFKDIQEVKEFLKDLLTEAELTAIAKRLAIAKQLQDGKSYDSIRHELKVSSATIATIQDRLNSNTGLKIALSKIDADQWAGYWVNKLMSFFGQKTHSEGK